MTDLANIQNSLQPPLHSPWSKMVIDTMRAECPERLTQEQRQQFITELAERLSTLREWERYDRHHLPSVFLKRGYKEIAKLEGHTDSVRSVHVLADGRIVSGSKDCSVRIWARDGNGAWRNQELNGHTEYVRVVQGLPDGRIVSGSDDMTVRVWAQNAAQGWSTESMIKFPVAVDCLQALPDGSIITGHYEGGTIHNRPNKKGGWSQEGISRTTWIRALRALPDNRIVAANDDGSVRFWTNGEKWSERSCKASPTRLLALQILPDGRTIVGGVSGFIGELVLNREGGFETSEICRHGTAVLCLQALPDGRIVSGTDREVLIWTRVKSGEWQREILEGHEREVTSLQVLANGQIVSGSLDGTIRIWDGTPVSDGGAS